MEKKVLVILAVLLISTVQVTAENIGGVVVKKTASKEIVKGDLLSVTISITNNLAKDMSVTVQERFGGAEAVDMGGLKRNTPDRITSAPPYYEAVLAIGANSEGSITYKIKPLYFGRFRIPATRVYVPGGGEIRSNTLTVLVECNRNGICEVEEDENAITCPVDCSPGERDELCNPLSDGVCDPDCMEGKDPDCGVTSTTLTTPETTTTMLVDRCGDGICAGENYGNCPQDCDSGGLDGYCDGLRDDRCDPDCLSEEDPDCGKPMPVYMLLIIAAVIIAVIAIVHKKWLNTGG